MTPKEYLRVILDQVDYERGACEPTAMVGAVLPREVLAKARELARAEEIADADLPEELAERARAVLALAREAIASDQDLLSVFVDRELLIKFEIRNAIAGSAHLTMLAAGLRSEVIVAEIYKALEAAGWLRPVPVLQRPADAIAPTDERYLCPYAHSEMTPCVIRDGDKCYGIAATDNPVCVGCGRSPAQLGREPPNPWPPPH